MENPVLILAARNDATTTLSDACHEAVELCNRLQVGIDMAFGGGVIEVRPGNHPYNLVQAFQRAAASSTPPRSGSDPDAGSPGN